MTDQQTQTLLDQCITDQAWLQRAGFQVMLELDVSEALSLVGNLQLALRHPNHRGASAQLARKLVDSIRGQFEGKSESLVRLIDRGDHLCVSTDEISWPPAGASWSRGRHCESCRLGKGARRRPGERGLACGRITAHGARTTD